MINMLVNQTMQLLLGLTQRREIIFKVIAERTRTYWLQGYICNRGKANEVRKESLVHRY